MTEIISCPRCVGKQVVRPLSSKYSVARRRTREPLLLRFVGWLVLLRKTKPSSILGKLYLRLSARQGRRERGAD